MALRLRGLLFLGNQRTTAPPGILSDMNRLARLLTLGAICSLVFPFPASAATADGKKKLVIIAGKPSHPPRMHEFRAGSLLLQKCLADAMPGLTVEVHEMGWVQDEATLKDADAVVIYSDGGAKHPALQGDH